MKANHSLYFDGCSLKNPGISGSGSVIYYKDEEIWSKSTFLSECGTNNEAEYLGLLEGLKKAKLMEIKKLKVYGDSMLIIKQMKGEYNVNAKNLKPFYLKCKELEKYFEFIEYNHVYREYNERADYLSKQATNL